MRSKYVKIMAVVLILASYNNFGYSAPESCTMPNCPSGCTGAGSGGGGGSLRVAKDMIVRTLLKSNKKTNISKGSRKPKRFIEDCITPLLPVVIDRQDVEALKAIGKVTNRRSTDYSIVNIDVGVAGKEYCRYDPKRIRTELPFTDQQLKQNEHDIENNQNNLLSLIFIICDLIASNDIYAKADNVRHEPFCGSVNTIMMDVGAASEDIQYMDISTFHFISFFASQSIDTADNPYQEYSIVNT